MPCNLSEGVYADGIDKGIDIGMAKLVTNYMAGKDVSLEQALEELMVGEERRAQIRELLARDGMAVSRA